jgi:predicted NUDIX family NTP pyrophosphohydrolase
MMQVSAGLLMYVREKQESLRVLLVHPGGPYWRNKDLGVWSIPKGLPSKGEDLLQAAQREFTEETSLTAQPPFIELTPLKQKGGKLVHCWAFAGAAAPVMVSPSMCQVEWPPRSGRKITIPEVDDAKLFEPAEALRRILPGQAGFVSELAARLEAGSD